MNHFDVEFRPLREVDLALLHEWTHRPHVARWWGGAGPPKELEHTRAKYLPRLRPESHIKPYLAWLAGQPIGFIQSYVAAECGDGWWEHETDPGVLGTDQFLSDENSLGRGIGTRMVTAFVQRLFHDPRITRIQTDPDPTNARAIRCYEKAGFRRARIVDTPAGKALLMFVGRSTGSLGDTMSVVSFLEEFTNWAASCPEVVAVALVGSHARGIATPNSDVDLVILCEAPDDMLAGDWPRMFGEVEFRSIEDYGALRSLRVHYRGGIEVEFGVARPSWAKVPLDAGTKFVLAGGARILHDPSQLLQAARRAAVA